MDLRMIAELFAITIFGAMIAVWAGVGSYSF